MKIEYKDISELPTDYAELRALTWELLLEQQRLRFEIEQLKKLVFGKRSERQKGFTTDQSELGQIESEQQKTATDQTSFITVAAHQRRKKHPGRNAIPSDIKRIEHICDISEEEKKCVGCQRRSSCPHKELPIIEKRKRTVVERIPAHYEVHEYEYIKRACPLLKDGVKTGDVPVATPIPRGLAGILLLLFVIISKYCYHLPLYRIQRQIYHESMIWFTRATMVGWIAEVCVLLDPIYKEMILHVKKSRVIYSDDSKVERITSAGSHTSYMWIYIGCEGRVLVYDYRETKSSVGPKKFLQGVQRSTYLMIDDNAAYNDAIKDYGLISLICWMHIRRKFIEAFESGYQKEYSLRIVRFIGQLYRIERFAQRKEMTADQRLELRKRFSTAVVEKIYGALTNPGFVLIPQFPISKAIAYALKNWSKAKIYLSNGSLPIDNGPSERGFRDHAVGRHNWGHVGSDEGGKRMAILYSIINTCKMNGIDFEEYLHDILMRVALRPPSMSVADLTPLEWLKTKNKGVLPKMTPLYPSKN